MADRSGQLVLRALSQAAAGAAPLIAGRNSPGLFPATAAGKQAAVRCRDEGYLVEGEGGCALSEKGRAFLLEQVSPRQVLEDFVRALEAREAQAAQLIAQARQAQAALEAMRRQVEPVLDLVRREAQSMNGLFMAFHDDAPARAGTDVRGNVLAALARWARSGALEDCPLPELYRQSGAASIGEFHDALRLLRSEGRLHTHPWTGPLYAIPEPACALLLGHDVTYYASLKGEG